jgi:hypothetical protein
LLLAPKLIEKAFFYKPFGKTPLRSPYLLNKTKPGKKAYSSLANQFSDLSSDAQFQHPFPYKQQKITNTLKS